VRTAAATGTPDVGLLRAVVDAFDVGTLLQADFRPEGLMNRNWRVETTTGTFALKELLDVDVTQALLQHQATEVLAELGLPVVAPKADVGGKTVVETPDARRFSMLPWVAGRQIDGPELTLNEARHFGDILAELHLALACDELAHVLSPPAGWSSVTPVAETATARNVVDQYLDLLSQARRDTFDRIVHDRLHERRRLVDTFADRRPDPSRQVAPIGWTHGDVHHLNVLWSDGPRREVAAVLDWDRLKVQPLGNEVVRAATLTFSATGRTGNRPLDLERVAAFTRGYRDRRPLGDAELADAIHRFWWERLVNDFWYLDRHYERDDRSCDHLFDPACALLAWWCDHRVEVEEAFLT
jgi:Ser/Thr protein kinase RdoA (MazF antagonist)